MPRLTWLVLLLAGFRGSYAITGSVTTTIENHPYTVAIDQVIPVYDDDDIIDYDISMLCAGALVGSKTVITAATCLVGAVEVKNATFLRVRVGAQFREGGGEAFAVSSVLPYPDWSEYDVNFDVMLLYLVDDVPLRAEAQHVALTPASAPSAGEKLIMTGYGDLKTDEVLPDGQVRQIQVATLPFLNQDVCEDMHFLFIKGTVSCAGGLTVGSCGWRDIGAPLVNWRRELVGVAMQKNTEDSTCGVLGMASTFTNLAAPEINKWVLANVDVEPAADY